MTGHRIFQLSPPPLSPATERPGSAQRAGNYANAPSAPARRQKPGRQKEAKWTRLPDIRQTLFVKLRRYRKMAPADFRQGRAKRPAPGNFAAVQTQDPAVREPCRLPRISRRFTVAAGGAGLFPALKTLVEFSV
jgi:hypothetical protein